MFGFVPRTPTDHAPIEAFEELESAHFRREERRVFLWRYWQARQTGVDPADARRFAASSGDLGTLRALVGRNGCPPALAVEILA